MPPRRRRKSRLRSAGKAEERDLIQAARIHRDDGSLVQIECVGRHFLCPVQRLDRKLAAVHARREDKKALQRRAKWSRGLARAYAGTLLLAFADKAPYVAQAKFPFGTYPYAMRGSGRPNHYIALQHWEDPRARLLAVADMVKRRRFRFFAVGDGLVCAHRDAPVPSVYVEQEAERLGLVQEQEETWTCPHPAALPAVVLAWTRGSGSVRVCAACGAERNTAHALLEHAAVPSAAAEYRVRVEVAPLRGAPDVAARDAETEERYLRGEVGDARLLEAAEAARRRALAAEAPPFFVVGDVAWREAAPFIDALGPSPAERAALEAALAAPPRAVVLERASAARALEAVWAERGEAALVAAAGGPEGARLHEPTATADRIAELLRRAAEAGAHRRAEEGLPRYEHLPSPARVADAVARAHRRGGREAALRAVEEPEPGSPRAVALAFRRVLGGAEAHAWKYAREETELAGVLVPYAKRLLEAAPAEYHEALADLARAAGVVEELRPES